VGASDDSEDGANLPWELAVTDVPTGTRRVMSWKGNDIRAVALDPTGTFVAAGYGDGAVRLGPVESSEPHLLPGSGNAVAFLEFSPDGHWLAEASGSEIWLWPVPDLSQPPLHTLPLETLLAKLEALTNVRVVEDESSPTGYRTDIGPFPGWQDTPAW
jgi:WD40 repeat protein